MGIRDLTPVRRSEPTKEVLAIMDFVTAKLAA